jgi:exonuclease-1
MGIKDLLPLLDPIANEMHIRDYAGKTVAVDGHSWLYCGAFDCAFELAINMTTAKYVYHCLFTVSCFILFIHFIFINL